MLNSILVVLALSTSVPTVQEHKACMQISSLVGNIAKLRDTGMPRSEALNYIYEMELDESVRTAAINFTNTVYDAPSLTSQTLVDLTYTGCVEK